MAANTSPIFILTGAVGRARVAAANTARDGSGTLVDLVTGSTDGTRVDYVTWTSAQASAAANSGMVGRLFITDSAGANPRLVREIAITAVTASNTAIGATQTMSFPGGIILVSGQKLQVCQSVYAGAQDQMDVIAIANNY